MKIILAILVLMLAACASHAPNEDMSRKDDQGITQWLANHQ